MNIPYSTILFVAFIFSYTPLPAQVISWIADPDDMNGEWETLNYNGLSTVDGTGVMCAFQTPGAGLITYDWQGAVLNELPLPHWNFLRQITDGHIIAGVFQGTAKLLGTTLAGGAGAWDVYLARLNSDGSLGWVINSVSHPGPNVSVSRVAASPSGRVAMLFGPSGAHQWGEDTIPELSAGRSLLIFDENGSVLWTKRLFSASNDIHWFTHAEIAINDAGEVWLSGFMPHDLIVDADTITASTSYGQDQLIARFSPNGTLTDHMVVPGWYPGPGMGVRGLLAWPDGRVFWAGSFRSGTVIGDTTLLTSGPTQGLFMEIGPDMNINAMHVLSSEEHSGLSAISGDPSNNIIRLGGVCGREAAFEGSSMDIDAAYTGFYLERNVSGGVNTWIPLLYTNDTINGYVWPLNVVERNGVIHTSGYRAGQVRKMDGTPLSSGDGFLIRLDDAGSVGLLETRAAPSDQLTCWPSPTEDFLNVALDMEGQVNYRIIALDGRVLHEGNWTMHGGQTQLSVGHLANGTYHLQVYSTERIASSSFAVDRGR